jgi:hypothetical protein
MKNLKFWPFEVSEDDEGQSPPASFWVPRVVIVSVIAGLAGLFVLFGLHL